jgi:hypothetical protein
VQPTLWNWDYLLAPSHYTLLLWPEGAPVTGNNFNAVPIRNLKKEKQNKIKQGHT